MASFLDSYVNPYFSQRWNFFAPTPPTFDIVLLARGRYLDPDTAEIEKTDWLDISDTLIGALRKNRLTPLFHAEISLSNALVHFVNYFKNDPRTFLEKGGKKYLPAEIPADVDPVDMMVMRRTAMADLEVTYPKIKFQSVQLGIMIYTLPRFTERHKGLTENPSAIALVAWQPAEWVPPYCCYSGLNPSERLRPHWREP